MIAVIYAVSNNGVIGSNNTLPWKLSKDLQYFRKLTTGNVVVMGRNTWESLPKKPLPKRFNVVISSKLNPAKLDPCSMYYQDRIRNVEHDNLPLLAITDDFSYIHKLEEAIKDYKLNKDIFLIGGKSIIEDGLKIATDAFVTEIHHRYSGDVFIDKIDTNIWQEYSRHSEEENGVSFDFVHYKRKI